MILKLSLALMLSVQIFAMRLEKAEAFNANYIQGNIQVTCFTPNGSQIARFRCSESYLDPSDFSKVMTEESIDADKVTLTYVDERGKKRTKSSKFSGNKSKSEFNLWIWTLTQKPLLKSGDNLIEYTLTKKNKTVETGSFNVDVQDTAVRTCRSRSYTSSYEGDCTNGANICNRYFREENYCL